MKNKLFLSSIVFTLLVLPTASFAQEEPKRETPKRGVISEEIESRREAVKNSVEERRQNVVDKIEERANKFIENVVRRFEAGSERLTILADRIDSRIAKISERDIDVTEAKKLMVEARAKIGVAETSILEIMKAPTDTASSSASTTPTSIKDSFNEVKVKIEKAKTDLKEAHAALVDVVNSLKPGDNKLKARNSDSSSDTATSSASEQ